MNRKRNNEFGKTDGTCKCKGETDMKKQEVQNTKPQEMKLH